VGTITGGTGRFEDASGKLITVTQVTPLEEPIPGIQFVNSLEGTTTGQISY
jgi:hypothetical protein